MAVSPLVDRPKDALCSPAPAASSPLKRAVSAQPSSNGTPRSAKAPGQGPTQLPKVLDMAEQMNIEEKRKFVKASKKPLGEGTYAVVYPGFLRRDPSVKVAIKKIKKNKDYKDGMAPDAIRELKFLQELHHPNIISLLSVFSTKDQNLNLVLEYLPLGDLEMLIRDTNSVRYGAADIKAWMGMMTRGVWFCHDNFVLHRDIKPNNLLIAADGEVKLADFGLARAFADPYANMTTQVITRWYRPLELLWGARRYSGAVDVWSVGTVFAELILRVPFLPGASDLDQISQTVARLGTPTEDVWPGLSKLPDYVEPETKVPLMSRAQFTATFGTVGPDGVDLLMKTLLYDPLKRITAREMLQHPWWHADPKPTRNEDLPRKAGGEKKAAEDLKRRPGQLDDDKVSKVARKLDFGQMK